MFVHTLILLSILLSCLYISLAVYRMLKAVQYIRDTGTRWLGVDVRDKCILVGQRPSTALMGGLLG